MVVLFTLNFHIMNFYFDKVTIQNKYLNKMHIVSISYDADNYKCYMDDNGSEREIEPDEQIDIFDTRSDIWCRSTIKDKDTRPQPKGFVLKDNIKDEIGYIDDYYANRGEKAPQEIILIPRFLDKTTGETIYGTKEQLQDEYKDKYTFITFRYNGSNYTIDFFNDDIYIARKYVNAAFPEEEWYIDDAILVNTKTNEKYRIDDPLPDGGMYNIEGIEPYVTFTINSNYLQFVDNPHETTLKYRLSKFTESPKIKAKDHYGFTGWVSSIIGINLNNIHSSINTPVTFTAWYYLKKWTVKFMDCGDTVTKTVTDGDMVTPPQCSKTGYTFNGWKESFTTCKSSNISIWLLMILFIISVIILFTPFKSSYIRNITRGIQSKTSY